MSDLRTQLTGIYQKHGELTPQIVVDEARPVDAPLHDRFEWNDEIAGEKYRLVQGARMIRVARMEVTIVNSEEKTFIRAFHSLHENGDDERQGYAPTEEILENEVTRKILLRNMEREISQLKKRYGHLVEFAETLHRIINDEDAA